MKKVFTIFLGVFFLSILLSSSLLAQAVHVYKVNTDSFPTLKANFWAKGATGIDYSPQLSASDFDVLENGTSIDAKLSVDCSEKPDTPGVSILLIIDVSGSMNDNMPDNSIKKVTAVQNAVKLFIDSLKFVNGTSLGINTFDALSYDHMPFQTSAAPCYTYATGTKKFIIKGSLTDFVNAYLGSGVNAFDKLAGTSADLPRHIIFITEAATPSRTDFTSDVANSILQKAISAKTFVHSIRIGNTTDANSKVINGGSGGLRFENIESPDDLNTDLLYIAGYIQSQSHCQLIWTTDYGCTDASKSRSLSVYNSKTKTTEVVAFTTPDKSVPKLTCSDTKFIFGTQSEGTASRSFTLSRVGPTITISSLSFSTTGEFTTTPTAPFTIKNGETKTIGINCIVPSTGTSALNTLSFVSSDAICYPLPTISLEPVCIGTCTASFDFPTTEHFATSSQTLNNVFTNKFMEPVSVTVTLGGTDKALFSIDKSGAQTVPAGGSLNIKVSYSPNVDAGTHTAEIQYTMPQSCGGPYKTTLTGNATKSDVKESYATNSDNLTLSFDPNPAYSDITIHYGFIKEGNVSLELYNSLGSQVETLVSKFLPTGTYNSQYNVSNLIPGVYFLKLQSGSDVMYRKLVITK